ncbi:MAG TPA: helix-turn-helix transcriptional regulator [Ramlibacter sp.]|jgi:transcriptional regulator with XRE-family HTH domain
MEKSQTELVGVFRRHLKEAREAKHWTQADLANAADVSVVTISKLEQGVNLPTFAILLALCLALDTSPNDLVGWEGQGDASRKALDASQLRAIKALGKLQPRQALAVIELTEKLAKD